MPNSDDQSLDDFWEAHYADRPQVWSGKPNAVLVQEVADLSPGTALDVGCGEGADAIWLAARGWDVTGTDVAQIALDRAARAAAEASVDVRWARHDLVGDFPAGTFDLVTAHFLHSPVEIPYGQILQAAARAVAPGGTLLIVGHDAPPPWSSHHDVELPSASEVRDLLELDDTEWQVVTCEHRDRPATGPEGQAAVLTDTIVKAHRQASPVDST